MNTLWKEMCTAVLLGAVLPGIIVNISAMVLNEQVQELPVAEVTAPVKSGKAAIQVTLRNADGTRQKMEMDDYLTGVLLGEMPSEFALEALKAQAVAARTYTAKAIGTGGKHGDGSLCADPACCQAYISPESYFTAGGTEENLEKVHTAVLETSGAVLTYAGDFIEATYFACSGGSTEDAVAVWGTDYPYLRSVPSPGEEQAAHFSDSMHYSKEALEERLGRTLPGSPDTWFGTVTYTPGGGVDTMVIAGETYTGIVLRRLLALPSTAFTVSVEGNEVIFLTRGYGHRVGMSQYGADAMAATGNTYTQILAHYYPGTKLEQLSDLNWSRYP